ncbi:MAG: ADP-ribosylglycohydrolase family protein [Myxococcota bacterium]
MTLSPSQRARARGCLLGQLVGDALGTTVEFRSGAAIREAFPSGFRAMVGGGPFQVLPGQVTDDSELALALARSLATYGPDFDRVAAAYVAWCRSEPIDIGGTTLNAFDFPVDETPVDAARVRAQASKLNDYPSKQANGALMRVSPLGIYGAFLAPERLAALARLDATLSHPTPPCQEASVAFVRAIAVGIAEQADPNAAYRAAVEAVDTKDGRASGVFGWLVEAADEAPDYDAWGMGWVRLAFQNAFYQLLHASSFEAAMSDTILAGGDTDTNAAIAGALLGAVHGESDIPPDWRETVLACRPPRPPTYWANDARELAAALLERGSADAGRYR